ncbi:MAG: SDR family NAD(P)-dependent oxidoreductase [Solirubrobacteraceae bacterium]|nr:SDR family NAD(P)-dependent oxidoreductase [Solirubrobacteraceae bacterium]
MLRANPSLAGRRVLITGAARGIGAALAQRLHERGARVALVGLEPELLEQVAKSCGNAPWREADVANQSQLDVAVAEVVAELGGLDVVVANAGIATQFPLLEGDPAILEQMLRVNVMGSYLTLRAAGPHIRESGGYALVVASLAAAVQLPLLGAYSASKAATEAIGNTLRSEIRQSGARVGVAYFAELDTEMTSRGFSTEAAAALGQSGSVTGVTPLKVAIDALERGIARRSRRIVAPGWVAAILPIRMVVQPVMDRLIQRNVRNALAIAATEDAPFTTPQPGDALVVVPPAPAGVGS